MMDDPLAQFWASPRIDNQSASVVQIESGRLVPLVIVLALMAGLGIGMSVYSLMAANKAEREARVLQERWNDLKVELVRRGIPLSDH